MAAIGNTNPYFAHEPVIGRGLVSAANTNRDGTGTVVTITTATTAANGGKGRRIERVLAKAIGTTTAGMVRLFLYDGSNYTLIHEFTVDAITPSATLATWEEEWVRSDGQPVEILPPGWGLVASTHNAESFHVHAVAGDIGN
jgi:hypothetical protein